MHHLFLIKPREAPSPRPSPMPASLARGGAVRLDLVPSRELDPSYGAGAVVVLLGLRAMASRAARAAGRREGRGGRAGTQVNLSSVFFMHSLKVWKNL